MAHKAICTLTLPSQGDITSKGLKMRDTKKTFALLLEKSKSGSAAEKIGLQVFRMLTEICQNRHNLNEAEFDRQFAKIIHYLALKSELDLFEAIDAFKALFFAHPDPTGLRVMKQMNTALRSGIENSLSEHQRSFGWLSGARGFVAIACVLAAFEYAGEMPQTRGWPEFDDSFVSELSDMLFFINLRIDGSEQVVEKHVGRINNSIGLLFKDRVGFSKLINRLYLTQVESPFREGSFTQQIVASICKKYYISRHPTEMLAILGDKKPEETKAA